MQLLDLMHTLHTKAAVIYNSWAQEPSAACTAVATDDQLHNSQHDVGPSEEVDAGTSALWMHCWCPLLQGMF